MDLTLLAARLWARVDKNGPVHPVLGTRCWLWTGGVTDKGYGRMGVPGTRQTVAVHRLAVRLATGEWPVETVHACDVKRCVRHVSAGTRATNMQDCRDKGRLRLPDVRGGLNPAAKLTLADVAVIRSSPSTALALAAQFGVTRATINNIRAGRTWR